MRSKNLKTPYIEKNEQISKNRDRTINNIEQKSICIAKQKRIKNKHRRKTKTSQIVNKEQQSIDNKQQATEPQTTNRKQHTINNKQ